jgi:hypothetical protein
MADKTCRLSAIKDKIAKTIPEIEYNDIAKYINATYKEYNVEPPIHLCVVSIKDSKAIVEYFTGTPLQPEEDLRKHLFLRFAHRGAFYCIRYPRKLTRDEKEDIFEYNPKASFPVVTNGGGYIDVAEYSKEFYENCKMEDYAKFLKQAYGAIEVDFEEFKMGFNRPIKLKRVDKAKSSISAEF